MGTFAPQPKHFLKKSFCDIVAGLLSDNTHTNRTFSVSFQRASNKRSSSCSSEKESGGRGGAPPKSGG